MTRILALPLLLAACAGDDTDALLADFASEAAALRATVDDHAIDVQTAGDLSAIPDLESGYASDWKRTMDDLRGVMDDLDGCTRGGDAMGMMSDARAACDDMDDEITTHAGQQDEYATLEACIGNETDHAQAMHAWLDQLDSDHDDMMGTDMTCHMGEMGSGR